MSVRDNYVAIVQMSPRPPGQGSWTCALCWEGFPEGLGDHQRVCSARSHIKERHPKSKMTLKQNYNKLRGGKLRKHFVKKSRRAGQRKCRNGCWKLMKSCKRYSQSMDMKSKECRLPRRETSPQGLEDYKGVAENAGWVGQTYKPSGTRALVGVSNGTIHKQRYVRTPPLGRIGSPNRGTYRK